MRELKIITWNVGAGAFGADADFSYEGGNHILPSERKNVSENVRGIQAFLAKNEADVYLLQELSSGSLLNKWRNVRRAVHQALRKYHSAAISNFVLPLFFDFLRNEHGMGTYVTKRFRAQKKMAKPYKKSEHFYYIIPRRDYALTTFVKRGKGKPLAIVNTHLSSFDTGGKIRISQFKELIQYVKRLNRRGHPVIIGADWNMQYGDVHYYENDEELFGGSVYKFPQHLIPPKWSSHFPTNAPTMRGVNRVYKKGAVTTKTIDGFVCSPGVSVEYVKTIDLDFQYSDHNPVEIVVTY